VHFLGDSYMNKDLDLTFDNKNGDFFIAGRRGKGQDGATRGFCSFKTPTGNHCNIIIVINI
jgi:hypothetical protein